MVRRDRGLKIVFRHRAAVCRSILYFLSQAAGESRGRRTFYSPTIGMSANGAWENTFPLRSSFEAHPVTSAASPIQIRRSSHENIFMRAERIARFRFTRTPHHRTIHLYGSNNQTRDSRRRR